MPQDTPQTPVPQAPGFPDDATVPDIYAEGVHIISMPNSMGMVFNRMMGTPPAPVAVAVIRVSPEQAKLMSLVLAKMLRDYEEQIGTIPTHRETLVSLGMAESEQP